MTISLTVSPSFARWYAHANNINPSPAIRNWLTDRTSLTLKLTARSKHFRVQRLRQGYSLCLADETSAIGLAHRVRVQEREVLLQCDEKPVVYAHTIVPVQATAFDWPFFSTLGERSLGTVLFGDPQVVRGKLQYARLRAEHPLARRISTALGEERLGALYARRCLYKRKKGLLLVTEVFLPVITDILPVSGHR